MNHLVAHSVIAFLACGLPILVVFVALAVARRATAEVNCAMRLPRRPIQRLAAATCAVWAAFAIGLTLDHRAVSGNEHRFLLAAAEAVASLALFWLLAVPALTAIQTAALAVIRDRAATGDARLHAASLVPRRVSDYLSARVRSIPAFACSVALTLLALRVWHADADALVFLPVANALIAVVFYVLYEIWLRAEAHGPQALSTGDGFGPTAEEADRIRRQRVRAVFAIQAVLSLFFSAAAHATVGLRVETAADGPVLLAVAAASIVVGGIGCALALSSEISGRCLGLLARQSLESRPTRTTN